MKCKCNILKKGPFKTEKAYMEFEQNINVLVNHSVLKKTGEIHSDSPFYTYEYFCFLCEKYWLLKIPDQAYRGGWFEK